MKYIIISSDADLTEIKNLWTQYNKKYFDNKLNDIDIRWMRQNKRMGKLGYFYYCVEKDILINNGGEKYIALNKRLLNDEQILKTTLLHEMCHQAVFDIDKDYKCGHCAKWKKWMKKCGLSTDRCASDDDVNVILTKDDKKVIQQDIKKKEQKIKEKQQARANFEKEAEKIKKNNKPLTLPCANMTPVILLDDFNKEIKYGYALQYGLHYAHFIDEYNVNPSNQPSNLFLTNKMVNADKAIQALKKYQITHGMFKMKFPEYKYFSNMQSFIQNVADAVPERYKINDLMNFCFVHTKLNFLTYYMCVNYALFKQAKDKDKFANDAVLFGYLQKKNFIASSNRINISGLKRDLSKYNLKINTKYIDAVNEIKMSDLDFEPRRIVNIIEE